MAMRPPVGSPTLSRRTRILLIIGAVVLVLLLGGSRLLDFYVDWLWFGEVGFRNVFTTVLFTRILQFILGGLLLGGLVWLTLWIAYRSRPVFVPLSGPEDPVARYRTVVIQRLRVFAIGIPVVIGLIAGLAAQGDWQITQMFLNGTSFGINDPEFSMDVSFYAFDLPFYRWVLSWLFVAVAICFVVALITHYLFGGIRLAGRSGQFSTAARAQLADPGRDVRAAQGRRVLPRPATSCCSPQRRHELLRRHLHRPQRGAAGQADPAVHLGDLRGGVLRQRCSGATCSCRRSRSVLLVLSAIADRRRLAGRAAAVRRQAERQRPGVGADRAQHRRDPRGVSASPPTGHLVPYSGTIRRLRRRGAGRHGDRAQHPAARPEPAREDVHPAPAAARTSTASRTSWTSTGTRSTAQLQDYVVAARELDSNQLTGEPADWINRHLVYTHGNGFVAAPANQVNAACRTPAASRVACPTVHRLPAT